MRETGDGATAVGVDMSIMRHPFGGSARWAVGLLRSLRVRADLDVRAWLGPRRLARGGPTHKVLNLLLDSYWLDVGIPRAASRARRDVLFMPVNLTSAHSPFPQVVTIHDLNFLLEPEAYDRAYAAYARHMFQASARRAAAITTVSEFSRGQVADRLRVDPIRITVVYPGLEEVHADAQSISPLPRPYALYVGATEPHKDVPALLEAWRALVDVDLDLAIVGQPGRDHERVTAGARAAAGRVHVVGRVSQDALEAWYANARVFVFPSRTEGFGYPPLEAMKRGVPVVACRSASLPEVLGQAALYHQPGASDEIAAHVRRILEDDGLRSQMIETGRDVSSRYNWPQAAATMARILIDRAAASPRGAV